MKFTGAMTVLFFISVDFVSQMGRLEESSVIQPMIIRGETFVSFSEISFEMRFRNLLTLVTDLAITHLKLVSSISHSK
jgi:hypothetical protein